jgi:hypothetical protein
MSTEKRLSLSKSDQAMILSRKADQRYFIAEKIGNLAVVC